MVLFLQFAIANGFAIGWIPDDLYEKATFADLCLLSPSYRAAYIGYLVGGQRQLKHHVHTYVVDLGKVVKQLPLSGSDSLLKVIATSPVTTAQQAALKKTYAVHRSVVLDLFNMYKVNDNPHFRDLTLSEVNLDSLPEGDFLDGQVIFDLRTSKEPTSAESNAQQSENADEHCITTSTTITIHEEILDSASVEAVIANAVTGQPRKEYGPPVAPDYQLRSSNEYLPVTSREWLEVVFPHLFPYGRGGFSEKRLTQVSREELLAHLMRLSTRRFQHYSFALHAYNIQTRLQMQKKVFVQCYRSFSPGTGESRGMAFGKLTEVEISNAHAFLKACSEAKKKGLPSPPQPQHMSQASLSFFQSLRLCTGAAQHSSDFTSNARVQIFSMNYCLGAPTWWLTVSTDDTCNPQLFYLANGTKPLEVPPSEWRRQTLIDSPGACALTFERILSVLFKYVLGFDIKAKMPLRHVSSDLSYTGGLLGVTEAFSACVEEQSRASLHAHIQIWTGRFPLILF